MKSSADLTDSANWERSTLPILFIADQSAAIILRVAALVDDVARVAGSATNAHDAIRGIRELNPDITVLDVGIAHGVELLMQVKARQPSPLVIILTHSVEAPTRQVCHRLGAEYFLDKVHEFHRLREIVIFHGSSHGDKRDGSPGSVIH